MTTQISVLSFVPFLLWLGVIVYLFVFVGRLAGRLASAVERIAAALERTAGDNESRP